MEIMNLTAMQKLGMTFSPGALEGIELSAEVRGDDNLASSAKAAISSRKVFLINAATVGIAGCAILYTESTASFLAANGLGLIATYSSISSAKDLYGRVNALCTQLNTSIGGILNGFTNVLDNALDAEGTL